MTAADSPTPEQIRAWADEVEPRTLPDGSINAAHVAAESMMRERHGHPRYIAELDGPGKFRPAAPQPVDTEERDEAPTVAGEHTVYPCRCNGVPGIHAHTRPRHFVAPSAPVPDEAVRARVRSGMVELIADDQADGWQRSGPDQLADALLAGPLAELLSVAGGVAAAPQQADEAADALDALYGLFIDLHGCKIRVGETRGADRCVIHDKPWPCPEVENNVAEARELSTLADRAVQPAQPAEEQRPADLLDERWNGGLRSRIEALVQRAEGRHHRYPMVTTEDLRRALADDGGDRG